MPVRWKLLVFCGNSVVRVSWIIRSFDLLNHLLEDVQLPGFQLQIPLLAVLDALRSDNPASRRVGETWMRSSLKSYLRYGQSLLHIFQDPS